MPEQKLSILFPTSTSRDTSLNNELHVLFPRGSTFILQSGRSGTHWPSQFSDLIIINRWKFFFLGNSISYIFLVSTGFFFFYFFIIFDRRISQTELILPLTPSDARILKCVLYDYNHYLNRASSLAGQCPNKSEESSILVQNTKSDNKKFILSICEEHSKLKKPETKTYLYTWISRLLSSLRFSYEQHKHTIVLRSTNKKIS